MYSSDEADPFIVFTVANYLLALPIEAVIKVVNYPPGNNLEATGLVHLGQFSIPLLNLHQKLTHQPQPTNSPFLIVTQGVQGELWAIPVDEPPNLVKLPKDCIRALPPSFERNGLSEIVSQIAVLSQEQTLTVFLLDVEQLKSSN